MESECPKESGEEERDRDSYLRWQKISLEQLGYTINLIFTLSGVILGFVIKTMMESKVPLPGCAHCMFLASIPFLGISILLSLSANVTRTLDFRYTRQAAYARWKKTVDHGTCHDDAETLGKLTWWLFFGQIGTFAIGATLLTLSIWVGLGSRI